MKFGACGSPTLLTATVMALSVAAGFAQTNPPASNESAITRTRRAEWAVPLTRPHLDNLYQVTTNLYRGAQPTAGGMAELKAMGIKTVVDLRGYHSDEAAAAGLDLNKERVPMEPWRVEDAEVVRFLKVVSETNNLPVFVHCERGADRTGMMCAIYRIVVCGWTKDEAIEEMTEGGFRFSPAWQNIVAYIRGADVVKLRKSTGLLTVEDRH